MATKTSKAKILAKGEAIGEEGCGDFWLIEVKPASEFRAFRYHTVGDPGHIIRIAGLRDNDEWDDQAWIVSKLDAHMEDHFLKADTKHAKQVLEVTGPAHHVAGDVFIRQLRKEAR
jgi:hypothetical protein